MTKRQWSDFSTGQQAAIIALGSVQVALAISAWVDLARRSARQVNGRKGVWAAVIAIDFVGPSAYFVKGRKR